MVSERRLHIFNQVYAHISMPATINPTKATVTQAETSLKTQPSLLK